MNESLLRFAAPATSSTDLLFGGTEDAGQAVVEVRVAGSLPVLTLKARAGHPHDFTVRASMPGLQVLVEAAYASNTQRPTVAQHAARWQVADSTEDGAQMGQRGASRAPVGWEAFWQRALGAPVPVKHRLPPALRPDWQQQTAGFQQARPVAVGRALDHRQSDRLPWQVSAWHQEAERGPHLRAFPHQDADRTPRALRRSDWQEAVGLRLGRGASFQSAAALLRAWSARHQEAIVPPPGISRLPVKPPRPPGYQPDVDLRFACPAYSLPFLVFGLPDCEARNGIPIRRVYIVLNNVYLRRASDNAPVPCFSMSLSLDADSWAWGFDASLPGSAQSLVEPTGSGPVELEASVNGTVFRVLAESLSRERSFGQTRIRVSGRGSNAVLDAPYSPQQAFGNLLSRSSQQLMEDVLTFNGVPLGYAIDYGLEAWDVPAGVFSHQGTYVSALAAIAQAGGGYLIPHPSLPSFKVRHRYPVAPWETATPDLVLPADVMVREAIAWREKPAYNRVYVSGQSQGVLGQVTRAGTAGDLLAPMVTDPLITTAAAARQRGLAVLADTGRQLELGLSLPVLPQTGIIAPGLYVQYVDGSVTRTGIVRSTQVTVTEAEVKQMLGVEVHA